MKTFWIVMPHLPSHFYGGRNVAKHFSLLNGPRPFELDLIPGEFVSNELPTATLIITLKDYDVDCFLCNGLTLVSEKLRRVMALGPSDVQYFEIDASRSSPSPQSRHYQIMHVPVTEEISDLEKSDYVCRHHPDGSVHVGRPYTLAFRHDAEPAHEIFYDRYFKFIFCTDEFAMRVLQSGCSGMAFLDPHHFFAGLKYRFRTLGGIEEDEWDPIRKAGRSKVIATVH